MISTYKIYIPKKVSLSAWEDHHTHVHTHVQLVVPGGHEGAHVSGLGWLLEKIRLLMKQTVDVTTIGSVSVVAVASSGRTAAPHGIPTTCTS